MNGLASTDPLTEPAAPTTAVEPATVPVMKFVLVLTNKSFPKVDMAVPVPEAPRSPEAPDTGAMRGNATTAAATAITQQDFSNPTYPPMIS